MTGWALTMTAYGLVVVGVVVAEVAGRRKPDRTPSFTTALLRAMRHRSAALGLVIAWWWLGWHFITGA